jgi:hypothetical protein
MDDTWRNALFRANIVTGVLIVLYLATQSPTVLVIGALWAVGTAVVGLGGQLLRDVFHWSLTKW